MIYKIGENEIIQYLDMYITKGIKERIKQHLSMKKQTIFKHLDSHNISNTKSNERSISWRILHSNILDDKERKCIEAFEIQKRSENLINGCIGRTINI